MDSILDAANLALEESGTTLDEIDAISAGITGMDWPEDYKLLKSSLIKTFGIKDVQVCNDSIVAMYSGTVKNYGAVLCAGTGLNVAVKSPDGDEFVLRFYIDDRDQGGSALGRRAIRKVFDAEIKLCAPTKLTELFLQNAHVKTVNELLHRYVTDEEFGGMAKDMVPEIIDLANGGDSVAIQLVKEFSSDLSRYIYAGLLKYDMLKMNMDVVLSGSVLKGHDNLLTQEITRELRGFAPNANVINSRFEPVVGAGLSALMMFDNYDNEKETILKNITGSAEKFKLIR